MSTSLQQENWPILGFSSFQTNRLLIVCMYIKEIKYQPIFLFITNNNCIDFLFPTSHTPFFL